MKTRPWMDGALVVAYRTGVRVYDLGYCIARCGLPGCPDNADCRRFQVYVVRWNWDGTFEWRCRGGGVYDRATAIRMGSECAEFEESYAEHDRKRGGRLSRFIEQANAEGRI